MNERSPHAIWKAKVAAKLPPTIDLQSGRNDLKPKRRSLTIGLPIAFGSVVIYGRRTRLGEPFKPVDLCRSQTLAVIVPPVEPSPEGWRKPTKICNWHHDVESLSGFSSAHELGKQDVDSTNKPGSVDFPGYEFPFQSHHLLNYPKTSGEKEDLRRVKQELSFRLDYYL